MARSTTLDNISFDRFVRDCELEFGYSPDLVGLPWREAEATRADLEQLERLLFRLVADPAGLVEFSRQDLLDRLGWRARFEFLSRHVFPVDRVLYEPVEPSVRALETALSSLLGGYLGVFGSPGSGKSSLLTQVLETRTERVVRYYAYVPDAQDPIVARGESQSFFHDVVLALEQAGIRPVPTPASQDASILRDRFYPQLAQLGNEWAQTGRKTIILIDGLDHIAREQHPERSLLMDLPPPSQVPDGALIILGSQTDGPLPPPIQYAVRQAERRVEMQPLDRNAVRRVLHRADLQPPLSTQDAERVFRLSAGHPLALVYLINGLRRSPESTQRDAILVETRTYDSSIEEQYHSYWERISDDAPLVHLFGLLARIRRTLDLTWIETWADQESLHRLVRTAAHYFRQESPTRWTFFHNSFRLLVLGATRGRPVAGAAAGTDIRMHKELAAIAAASSSDWAWEQLYHLISADDHRAVLARATPDWFRSQFMAYRPADAIRTDIQLSLRSAVEARDVVALTRLVLSALELEQRDYHLRDTDFVQILLSLGKVDPAIEYLRDGNRLRTAPASALRASRELQAQNHPEEALRVFNLAEPLDLLGQATTPEHDLTDDDRGRLKAWAEAAVHFRDASEVSKAIRGIRFGSSNRPALESEDSVPAIQSWLLFRVGLELLHGERWADFSTLQADLANGTREDRRVKLALLLRASTDRAGVGDDERAREFLDQALAAAESAESEVNLRLALAEESFLTLGNLEQARRWLQTIEQPSPQGEPVTSANRDRIEVRFRLNRLLAALGDEVPPSEAVSNAGDSRDAASVRFEQAVCQIAAIWGAAWRGGAMDRATFLEKSLPIIRLFSGRSPDRLPTWGWGDMGSRGWLYQLLIHAAAQHGSEHFQALRDAFEAEWDDPNWARYWPMRARRQVIRGFLEAGASRGWAVNQLRRLELALAEGPPQLWEWMEEINDQIRAWIDLGELADSQRLLSALLTAAIGVAGEEDYQVSSFARWLDSIIPLQPEFASERVGWLSRAILALKEGGAGHAAESAGERLLETAFRWSPRRAVRVLRWLVEHGIITYPESARALLRAALNSRAPAFDLIASFLVPPLALGVGIDRELLDLLIRGLADARGAGVASETAHGVLASIDTFAPPQSRPDWRRALAGSLRRIGGDLREAGLSVPDMESDREATSSERLVLTDGTVLEAFEVRSRLQAGDSWERLVESEAPGSYFDWTRLIREQLPSLDRATVQLLSEIFRTSTRSAEILALISVRLNDLGASPEAWELAQAALAAARRDIWHRHWDGGRLEAFRALVALDKTAGRRLIWEEFAQGAGERWTTDGLAVNLEVVLPLLVDDLPTVAVWAEIESYLTILFSSQPLPPDRPEGIDTPPVRDTASVAICEFFVADIDHPVSALSHAIQRAFARLIAAGNGEAREALRDALRGPEGQQESALVALEAATLAESRAAEPLRGAIEVLRDSPNFAIRAAASKLAQHDEDSQETPGTPRATVARLRPSYMLEVQHRRLIVPDIGTLPPGEPLPNVHDPAELVQPFLHEIAGLAELAGVPLTNVIQRVVDLMRALGGDEAWRTEAEVRLRARLDLVGLRFTFRRPRSTLVRRALLHAASELVDDGLLSAEELEQLKKLVRFHDPAMILSGPAPRPTLIPPTSGLGEYGRDYENWVRQLTEFRPFTSGCDGDEVVVAEVTDVVRLGRRHAEEFRGSGLVPGREFWQRGGDPNALPVTVSNRLVSEYLTIDFDPEAVVAFRHEDRYDSPGANWLAFNPRLAWELGWSPVQEGWFRWVDGDGATMVESIWWCDGLAHGRPGHEYEVGDGWLVVASQPAATALADRLGVLRRVNRIKRTVSPRDDDRGLEAESTWHERWP